MNNNPKLYVGTYKKYNRGSIAGKWIDLTEFNNADEFFKVIRELHKDESDPEFMFQDFECFPDSMYSESMNAQEIEIIIEYASLLDNEREIVDEYLENIGGNNYNFKMMIDSVEFIADEESILSTEKQYAIYMLNNSDISSDIQRYIDLEMYAKDLLLDYTVGEKYIFRNW